MNRLKLFITIIAIGSLWGVFEIMPLPTLVLCVLGIFFLVLGRRLINITGSSIVIGLVVCLLKTYSTSFFECQWAGVLSLAISFDIIASFFWSENWWKVKNVAALGALTNLIALPIFVVWVTFITREHYWVEGGWSRVAGYAFESRLPAMILSLAVAPIGFIIGNKLKNKLEPVGEKLILGYYYGIVGFSWIIASIFKIM